MDVSRKLMQVVSLMVAVSFTLSGCASYKVHPDFQKRHKDIYSAAMVAPDINVYMLTFKGEHKMMPELVPDMDSITRSEMEAALESKGYTVKKLDLSETNLNTKPELKTALFNVRKIFDKELEGIIKNKKSSFEYTLGSDVNVLADEAGSDVLIFVKEEAFKKDASQVAADIAKDVLVTAASLAIGFGCVSHTASYGTVVHMAVVDSNDGAILWYNSNVVNCEYDPANKKHLEVLMKSIIKPFPASVKKTAADVKAKEEKKAAEKAKIATTSNFGPANVVKPAVSPVAAK